jgi:sec-independent protein translocase protein TatA
MPNLRWQELLIIVLIVVLLFGAKRLPDAARGIGRSLRIFKAETKGLADEGSTSALESSQDKDQAPAEERRDPQGRAES